MKCFYFSNKDKTDKPKTTKSNFYESNSSSTSMNPSMKRSSSEFNSPNISHTSTDSSTRNLFPVLSQNRSNNLRVFALEDLKIATRNFSRSLMIGEGGFGGVYRGVINVEDSCKQIDVAVKQLSRRGLQGHKEWVTEVNVLGVVEHPNLVRLVGYCAEDDERGIQRLLVYEYMPNHSVQDHLSNRFQAALPWSVRMKIAQDAAHGLTYLHEGMEFQIIFRDFKSSNILLDENWNAKVSDFGLARMGPADGITHVSTAVVGTIGYAAPEYIQTGRLTYKSDVWSYGVFLYELITGRRPFDRNRPKIEQNLLEWVRPHLSDITKFKMIIDPRLEGNYYLKQALKLAAVANRCLSLKAKARPKMSEVLEMINRIVEPAADAKAASGPRVTPEKPSSPKDAIGLPKSESTKRGIVEVIMGGKGCPSFPNWSTKLVTTC